MKNKKLSAMGQLFCEEYLVDRDGNAAAIRAGYSERTARSKASHLLKEPAIRKEINRLMKLQSKRTDITADKVLKNIVEIGDRCMQKFPVMIYDKVEKEYKQVTELIIQPDGTTKEVGMWAFKEIGALKAQELLGKHLKLFTDKLEIEATLPIRVTVNRTGAKLK